MDIYEKLINKESSLCVVGLGYVGMPIAIAFAEKGLNVIGFDTNKEKIEKYRAGIDPTKEVGDAVIKKTSVKFTFDEKDISNASFIIIAVPTPVNHDHTPNLFPVKSASSIVGRNLTKGSIIVYESTVYPGVTEDICIPIIEDNSGMECGVDYKVGYSPERINPGDKDHRLNTITKVVSGIDGESIDEIARVYEIVLDAGVYKAESIKVAEAAKVIENSQRDINIAFMNELSIIFNRMGIDTQAVLRAAGTKWNFLSFFPGLVGGHCIGVDPYYLTYKAEMLGYHSQIILSGRRINDYMGKYVAENCVKLLIANDKHVKKARVGILGLTFKENCPDVRNTKVIDIVNEMGEYGIVPLIYDPVADSEEAKELYSIELAKKRDLTKLDALIVAVAHHSFCKLSLPDIDAMYDNGRKIMIDIKGIYEKKEFEKNSYCYWRL